MKMPDITPMQFLAALALGFLVLARNEGWIDEQTFQWATGVVGVKVAADVGLRASRNARAGKEAIASGLASAPTVVAAGPTVVGAVEVDPAVKA